MRPLARLRLGVLGCGMIGHAYLRQAHTMPGFEVTGVCSLSESSRASALSIWPTARAYPDRAALLADPACDAVLICTPHRRHAEDAAAALGAGKHVLIEKPLATDATDLEDLEAVARSRPELSVLALPIADSVALEAVRDCCNTSAIGKIVELSSTLDVPGPPRANWYYSRDAIGGPSLDTLPYALARLLALTGPTLVAANVLVTQAIRRRRCLDGGTVIQAVEDQITLQLAFQFGQQAVVKSSWCVSRPEDYLLVRGRNGDARLDCQRNILHVRCERRPTRRHRIDNWDGEPAYRIDVPKTDPEQAKLNALAELVARRGGTLAEASYVTKIILNALAVGCGPVPLPQPPSTRPRLASLDMHIGKGYV